MEAPCPFEGFICDLDGTLLDTEPIYFDCYKAAAENFGKPDYTYEDHHVHIVGRPEVVGVQVILDLLDLKDTVTVEEFMKARDEVLLQMMPSAKPLPGALELAKHLKSFGKPMAIATSSSREYMELKKKNNSELFSLFETVVCGDEERIKSGKPAPDIFLAAASDLGVEPTKCLAFEDAASGVAAASAAGMTVVAVPDERLRENTEWWKPAKVVLSSLEGFNLSMLQ